jgi:hypothetical protein
VRLTENIKAIEDAEKVRKVHWKSEFDLEFEEDPEQRFDTKWTFGEEFLTACCKFWFEFPGLPENSFCGNCSRETEALDAGDPTYQLVIERAMMDEDGEMTGEFNGLEMRQYLNPNRNLSLIKLKQLPQSWDKPIPGWEDFEEELKYKGPPRKTLADVQKRLRGN